MKFHSKEGGQNFERCYGQTKFGIIKYGEINGQLYLKK